MNKEYGHSIQYMFTAYLMKSLDNTVRTFMKSEERVRSHEYISNEEADRLESPDIDAQYFIYKAVRYDRTDWKKEGFQTILDQLDSQKLIKALQEMKDREKGILLARIFGELTFAEIGEIFDLRPKQAEMAYYYIIRKLRKKMED